MWFLCFGASVAVLLITVFLSLIRLRQKKDTALSPLNTMLIGVFIASVLVFVPIYAELFETEPLPQGWFKTVVISIHHAIRLFIVDSDFDIIKDAVSIKNSDIYNVYSCYAAVLFVLSPLLTFGIIISFFKNVSAYQKYLLNYHKDVYVFSALNDKSFALAASIKKNYNQTVIVFANEQEETDEVKEMMQKIKALKAIWFRKNIQSVKFRFHSPKREIVFVMIDDDEIKNINLGLEIIKQYQNREKTGLYVFSNETEGEVLLSSVPTGLLKMRRVSDARAFIYYLLDTAGESLFQEAVDTADFPGKKLISCVVVGLGKYGTEMLKSLAWFGQMSGYRLELTAFDKREDARERFEALCPELMDEKYNNQFDDNGESQYKIDIRSGVDAETSVFLREMQHIKAVTCVFVDIGSDEKNIRAAMQVRSALQKRKLHPRIMAVVKDAEKKRALEGIKNYSGQYYDIDFVGDIQNFYTVGNVIGSDLEKEALKRHLHWGAQEEFWRYEYNYRSSVASALHRKMKIICEIPGIEKAPEERSQGERLNLRMLEHRRWNAYMRSEGYTYDKQRDNLAKTHPCLLTYEALSPEDKAKDDD